MQLGKENFLDMRFVHKKGLILKWNFTGFLRDTVYFHHLFVLMSHQSDTASELLTSYFQKLKQGDLIAFLYVDIKGRCRKMNWTEKDSGK